MLNRNISLTILTAVGSLVSTSMCKADIVCQGYHFDPMQLMEIKPKVTHATAVSHATLRGLKGDIHEALKVTCTNQLCKDRDVNILGLWEDEVLKGSALCIEKF